MVSRTLDSLRSVKLACPIIPSTLHDFLRDPQRCSDSRFQIGEKERHTSLSRKWSLYLCFRKIYVIFGGQEFRLLRFYHKSIPPYVQYACHYWFDHGRLGNLRTHQDYVAISWTTLASLVGGTWLNRRGIKWSSYDNSSRGNIICRLQCSLVYTENSIDLKTGTIGGLWSRTVGTCHTTPNGLYCTWGQLLKWHPFRSTIRDLCLPQDQAWFEEDTSKISLGLLWNPKQQIAVFSHDGKLITSASEGEAVRLWDTSSTGKQCGVFWRSYQFSPLSCVFTQWKACCLRILGRNGQIMRCYRKNIHSSHRNSWQHIKMKFSNDGTHLHMSHGTRQLKSSLHTSTTLTHSLYVTDQRTTCNMKKLLTILFCSICHC